MNNKKYYSEQNNKKYKNTHGIFIIQRMAKQKNMKITKKGCKSKCEIDTEIFHKKKKTKKRILRKQQSKYI